MMTQDILPIQVRAAAILTNAYVSYVLNTLVPPTTNLGARFNQLIVYLDFTLGSLTNALIVIEFSQDGVVWFQETSSSISAGVDTIAPVFHTYTASGRYRYALPIKDPYIRISVIGTGTVTGSSATIAANLGTD